MTFLYAQEGSAKEYDHAYQEISHDVPPIHPPFAYFLRGNQECSKLLA